MVCQSPSGPSRSPLPSINPTGFRLPFGSTPHPYPPLLSDPSSSPPHCPQAQVVSLQESLDAAEKRAHDGELIRRKLHNTIQELKGNIRVFCRVRPLNATEQVSS